MAAIDAPIQPPRFWRGDEIPFGCLLDGRVKPGHDAFVEHRIMSDTTKLQLPLLAANQAQKHVTHNEAILKLDGLVQLRVLSFTTTAEPGSPADGDIYLLPSGKTGTNWGGAANYAVAHYRDGAWYFYAPAEGWRAWVCDTDNFYVHNGTSWVRLLGASSDGSASTPAFSFASDTNIGLYRIGADILGFAVNGAEALRLSPSGLSLDGGSTTISPFKYATFTPTFSFATPGDLSLSYGTRYGAYVQIGSLVLFQFGVIVTPTYTTASGNAKIGSLPVGSQRTQPFPVHITNSFTWPTGATQLTGLTDNSGATTAQLFGAGSAISPAALGVAHFPSGVSRTILGGGAYLST